MKALMVESVKHKFQDNAECPFCSGRLQHTGAYDPKTGEPVLICSNADCFFNQVDFA